MSSILHSGPALDEDELARLGDNVLPPAPPFEDDEELSAMNRSLALFDADLPSEQDPFERAIDLGIFCA